VLEVGALIQGLFFAPDCNKIATTAIVNQAEKLLQQNLAAWQGLPAEQKTAATQQQALANFDNVWNQVLKACGSGAYGSAGQACIADRQQGACHYTGPGGACWNWFTGYRDPIANDSTVAASLVANPLAAIFPGMTLDPDLLLGLAAIGIGFLIFAL
jgi:hypothetical protein